MSRVLGIIAEYNPFHNGHLYHLNKSKQETGSSYTIAVISGNFSQRGETALINKWDKTAMALASGVDLVIELPVLYSVSSAENFADGYIKLLNSLNIVDDISFGAETPDISILQECADVLYYEPREYKAMLTHELDKGFSFPKARENALLMYLNDIRKFANVLSSPNNILSIEYLKALRKYNSRIQPCVIKRYGNQYNDTNITGRVASSTAIRNVIKNNGYDILRRVLPTPSYSILINAIQNGHVVYGLNAFEKEIIYNLRKMSVEEIAKLPDVSEGLEFAIKNAANSCNSIIEFMNIIKSKRYTLTRLQRILVYSLLGINKKDMMMSKKINPYIRVLGFNEKGKYLLSEISRTNPKLEIITSVKKFVDNCRNKNLLTMLNYDIWATNVYTLGYEYDSWNNLDYTHKIIKYKTK